MIDDEGMETATTRESANPSPGDAVVTMVEGEVSRDRVADLIEAFPARSPDELGDSILGTMLVQDTDSDRWRIVTLWRSMDDLREYRASVETPAAIEVFRAAGAEPHVTVWTADLLLLK